MGEAFDSFNAPQFVDFSKAPGNLDESIDSYFDIDHENELNRLGNSEHHEFFSPSDSFQDATAHHKEEDPLEKSYDDELVITSTQTSKRKSMSVGNLVLFNEEEFTPYLEDIGENMKQLNISHDGELKTQIPSNPSKNAPQSSSVTNTSRWKGSQEHLNKLAQPKRYASAENLKQGNNGQFVSLAEAINKFQNRTPVRFRSKPNLKPNQCSQALFRTVPESPALQTKARSRPVHVMSQEERENIEIENQKKFKIRANPVNKKILHGPIKPTVPVEKKAPTVPKPFKLTSAPSKKTMPSPKKYEFHAKPVPRSAEKPKKTQENERRPLTRPKTPTFMKNYKKPVHLEERISDCEKNRREDTGPRKPTKPMPFSFENRDKMVEKKRQQLVDKIREEERKAREFHAKPLPKTIYKRNDSMRSDSESSRNSSRRQASTENLFVQFKARPPSVLYKEPFVPTKPEKPLTEPEPFVLNSEYRAHEREEFEREKREREEKLEYLRKLEEEEKLRQEQEEIARLRKEREYKAKPIIKYKEVIILPSNKVTEPISPNFKTDLLRKMKNKENIPNNCKT